MELLVVMDPLDTLEQRGDTSIALLSAALERSHSSFWCTPGDLWLADGIVGAEVTAVAGSPDGLVVSSGTPMARPLAEFDVVLVRSDPPVDSAYLAMTLLLEHARGQTLVVNDPRGLREANEKLYACRFPDVMPAHLVSADRSRLVAFAARFDGAVLKPLDGHGGHGVVRLEPDDPSAAMIVDHITDGGRRPVMAQEFLPGVIDGDRRILLLDGEPLGAVLRRPAPGEFRANLVLGGTAEVVGLDDADHRIIEAMAPRLRADGLAFVGIDVIDGRLSEVNVTSPTGLRQLTELSGTRPDLVVIDWLEGKSASR